MESPIASNKSPHIPSSPTSNPVNSNLDSTAATTTTTSTANTVKFQLPGDITKTSTTSTVTITEIERLEKRNQFLEKELEYVKSELQSTRRILTERDELLLQLQWDESDREVDYEGQKKKKKSKDKVMTEERQKIDRLRAQMKLMENALAERDLNINRLNKEVNDTKTMYLQFVESLKAPREMPQRSKTSWGFRSSPSSSPLQFKPSPNSSPAIMNPNLGKSTTPGATPTTASPTSGLASPSTITPMSQSMAGSSSSPSTQSPSSAVVNNGSPAMASYDYSKKMQKKPSFWTFKKTDKKKPQHPHIQDTNWAQAQAH